MKQLFRNTQKGFTLVELMVVLVIIGILATMAIPKFMGAANKSKAAECKPVLKEIYTLQTAYKMETDSYATSNAALGFSQPSGTPRFTYNAVNANTNVGHAEVAGTAIGDAAVGEDACITDASSITVGAGAEDLGGYLNVAGTATCP